jgi:hypothetical protein
MVSLCGRHLLRDRRFGDLAAHPLEVLAVELVEVDAVGLVSDQEIEPPLSSVDERLECATYHDIIGTHGSNMSQNGVPPTDREEDQYG